jgi:uncharacterized protein YecE (DUF72 family)
VKVPGVAVGTSGYVYPHWRRGVFYPAGWPQKEELSWYSQFFSTVELNNPFYRLPTREQFEHWAGQTPDQFRFAVKVSRYISHLKRLKEPAEPLARLLESAEGLGPKLGPLLVQLPPTFQIDLPRLETFLGELPARHRWVLEVRHPSWQVPETWSLLARFRVALCVPVGGRVQPDLITTAPFTYIRMHAGSAGGGGFSEEELRAWAARIRGLAGSGKDVYVYFNNDAQGHAVRDAATLLRLLAGPSARRRRSGSSRSA